MPRLFRSAKYEFDPVELKKLGEDLAREAITVYELEREKKEVTAQLNADLKEANGRVADLARKVHQGFEMREVEVQFIYDAPKEGMKRCVAVGTGEVVSDEPMTPEDRQRSLELGNE